MSAKAEQPAPSKGSPRAIAPPPAPPSGRFEGRPDREKKPGYGKIPLRLGTSHMAKVMWVTPMIVAPSAGGGYVKVPIEEGMSKSAKPGSMDDLLRAVKEAVKAAGGIDLVGSVHVIMRAAEEPAEEGEGVGGSGDAD